MKKNMDYSKVFQSFYIVYATHNASNSNYLFPFPLDLDDVELSVDLLHLEPVDEREGGVCEHPVHDLPQLRQQRDQTVAQERQPWTANMPQIIISTHTMSSISLLSAGYYNTRRKASQLLVPTINIQHSYGKMMNVRTAHMGPLKHSITT